MNRRRLMALSALAGMAAAAGHAPFGLWPVAMAGFAALIFWVAHAGSARAAFAIGWAGGVGYFAVALHWIVEPFLIDVARHGWMAPFALVLMSGGLALFWGAAGAISARLAGNRALAFVLCLAAAEVLRGHVLTGFPWALPAYIWADTPVRMLASVLGPYGLTVLTLVVASFPALFRGKGRHRSGRRKQGAGILLAFLALGLAFGIGGRLAQAPLDPGGAGKVRLVQPNAPQDEKWDPERAHRFVSRQIDFTARPKDGVGLTVWPETAIPYRLDDTGPVLAQIAAAAEGGQVVSGINRVLDGTFRNALILIGPTGRTLDVYDKVHLVPFGEYIPLGQVTRLFGMQSLAARDGYGFSPGDGVRLIDTAIGRALPLICYEVIFPGHGRGSVERPDYLLQITNDAWFGTFSGPYQHLDQARFRAAEQGLPLIRSANTGVSAVIDANGDVVRALGLGEAGYLDVAMPGGRPATVYARTGDRPVIVALFAVIIALALAGMRNAIAKRGRTE